MSRVSNWEQNLNQYLSAHLDAKFDWGRLDCALFVAGAVEAQTGVDHGKAFRGAYSDEAGAMKAIVAIGGAKNIVELMDGFLPRRVRSMVQRGDVVMCREGYLAIAFGAFALGVGEEVATGRQGLIRLPPITWVRAWAVE